MSELENPTAKRARLFSELCDLAERERRTALDRLAAEDAALAGDLELMFALDDRSRGPIESLRGEVAAAAERRLLADTAETLPPSRLGAWLLGERLGEGGMGEVWAAERVEGGFTQRAAVKLVRAGMASRAVVERFEVERQLLARFEHAAIAQLFDGGVAPDGRPWFAMERVDGLPLTRFADEGGLDLAARLRLFLEVTEAVDFAHRSLVVHRDLKPSNILVTTDGAPKLLDFGLAKLVEADYAQGADALRTRSELRALTPAYAAPEQIAGEPIGTSTDVYALGVILFELLTGELPNRRRSSSAETLVAGLAHEKVERPSSRLRRLGPANAGSRRPTARRLEGDLDTIVLKALAREPARRYPSAALLGADIVAHLEGRPIAARPDSAGYRFGKFVRRHRLGVAASGIVLVALIAALGISLAQTRRANLAAAAAELEARRAERVKGFLISVFEQADPTHSMGADMSARRILEEGARRLEAELQAEPEVRAELYDAVARIQSSLGLLDEGLASAERAAAERARLFGEGSRERAQSLTTVGSALLAYGRIEEASGRFAEAIRIFEATGDDRSVEYARALSGQGFVGMRQGNLAAALEQERRVHGLLVAALGPEDAETLEHLTNVAVVASEMGRYAEAVTTYREVLAILEPKDGPESATVLAVLLNLAVALDGSGQNEEALELLVRVVEGRRKIFGLRHPLLAQVLVTSGLRLSRVGRNEEALAALSEARGIYAPFDHLELGSVDNYTGLVLAEVGRFAEAERAFEGAVARFTKNLGADGFKTINALANEAFVVGEQGRLVEAEAMFEGVEARLKALGEFDNPRLVRDRFHRGSNLRKLGRFAESRQVLEAAVALTREKLDAGHLRIAEGELELARLDLAEYGTGAVGRSRQRIADAEAIIAAKPSSASMTALLVAAKAELEESELRRSPR